MSAGTSASGGGAASLPFDTRALTAPVDKAELRAYTAQLKARGEAGTTFAQVLTVVVVVFAALIFLTLFGSIATVAVSMFSRSGARGGLGVVVFVIMIGVIAAAVVALVRGIARGSERRFRLARFAASNGMSYLPTLSDPALPGMIFGRGSSRSASDLVRGERPRFVEFANYRYTTGSGKNRTTHRWGYVAIKLDVPLPHIVLDALSNNGLFGSNLPQSFDRDQRLSLEGDFDQHFALYCPNGYERDALYLFTPDIMARFIDNAAALDVEIVDQWLFLYAKRDMSTLDPATWAWLFGAVGALLDKLAQWGRWRDEHLGADAAASAPRPVSGDAPASGMPAPDGLPAGMVTPGAAALPFAAPPQMLTPPPGVAPQGRRLQKRVPVATIIVMVIFGIVWLAMQSGLLTQLMR
ncbi:hypothetical protein CVS47_03339 [Microbacterium lemovicicum]|uniref:DUF3137 domain-containing protein n=1 Tax=Microbacterium lemovicicum TaxID=1072463 RepID=A0A3Q9J699_9MICO|nr:hypothetical protein [Microbacterium lemovicicum]AZS38680.1 hypothetical protein CVS47_03339 [Microbacterium lemovicicum]